ncbi:hypothetical protein V6N13_138418 [Hibiscus sabdariffa]
MPMERKAVEEAMENITNGLSALYNHFPRALQSRLRSSDRPILELRAITCSPLESRKRRRRRSNMLLLTVDTAVISICSGFLTRLGGSRKSEQMRTFCSVTGIL